MFIVFDIFFDRFTSDSRTSSNTGGFETERADRNVFVQELLLSTLTEQLQVSSQLQDPLLFLDSCTTPCPEPVKEESTSQSTPSATIPNEQVELLATESSCNDGGGSTKANESSSQAAVKTSAAVSLSGSSSSSAVRSAVPVPQSSIQSEGRSSPSGSGLATPSPPSLSHNLHQPSSRPPLLAAALPSSPPLPPSQGSTVNLNEHAMSLPPTPSRQPGAMSPRDGRLNPAAAKRSMLKHHPASRGATDMDPPPH